MKRVSASALCGLTASSRSAVTSLLANGEYTYRSAIYADTDRLDSVPTSASYISLYAPRATTKISILADNSIDVIAAHIH